MRKFNCITTGSFVLLFVLFAMTGCSDAQPSESTASFNMQMSSELVPEASSEVEDAQVITEPLEMIVDWSGYFDNLNGAAVIYSPGDNCYQIYNRELALTQRSPCSTFKIISSLTALENGIIGPENSERPWSGETFWNENWNKKIAFQEAFQVSCVWYFREIIDEIGKDRMQKELDKLQYGNCDISDWEGHLNTNNNNRALTGFWIESSLKISPIEQTQVMERIFGLQSGYRKETQEQLMQAMSVSEVNAPDVLIYGKTGMGKQQGIVVDAWFTGFADVKEERIYFCVYLGETDGGNVSSARAKEIAIQLVSERV